MTNYFDLMPHPGWVVQVVDDEFVYEYNNKYHKAVTGYGAVAGLTPDDLNLDPYIIEAIKNNYRRCLDTRQTIQYEEMVPIIGKSVAWWYTQLTPVIEAGQVVKIIGVSTEITSLKNALQDLEQFVYIISHDMQTPISSIIGLVGLLKEQYGDSELVQLIVNSANQANDHISGLLQYSRSSQLDNKDYQTVSINRLISRIVDIMGCKAEIIYDKLPSCYGNEPALQTVFRNLIENSCKFNDNERKVIKISGYKESGRMVYCVADNGIGILSKDFDKVFQPFRRLHSKKHYSGNGLGLSITKNIIQRHGGSIFIISPNEMGGTTFTFSIKDS